MAVSSQQIIDFLLTNPSDAEIAVAMATYGVSPADLSKVTGSDEGEIAARVAATLPPNEAVLLGDTYVQAINTTIGSGEDQQVGGVEKVVTYKANDNKVGGDVKQFSPTGEYQQTTKQQEVNATKDFLKFAAGAGLMFGGGALLDSLSGLGGGGAATGAEALGSTVGSTAGSAAGTGLGTVADVVGMGGGTGLTGTAGGLGINAGATSALNGITVGGGLTGTGVLTGSGLGTTLLGTGTGLAGLTGTGLLSGSDLGTSLLGTTSTTPLVGTGVLSGSNLGAELLGTGANTAATVGGVTGLTNTANVGMGALDTGVTTGNIGLGNGALNTGVPSAPYTISTTPVVPTTPTTPTTPVTPTTPPVVPPTTPPITLPAGLTPAMIQSILGLIGTTAVASSLTPSRTSTPTRTSIPTQGVPLNSEDYFKAIQANYNQIMPNVPRDVSTPLAAWYNSQYGA